MFITIVLNSYLVDYLCPFHLGFFSFLELYYFFVSSFWLSFCARFCVLEISSTSPGLQRVALCRRCPVGPSGTVLSGHRAGCSVGVAYGLGRVHCVCCPVVVRLGLYGHFSGCC